MLGMDGDAEQCSALRFMESVFHAADDLPKSVRGV